MTRRVVHCYYGISRKEDYNAQHEGILSHPLNNSANFCSILDKSKNNEGADQISNTTVVPAVDADRYSQITNEEMAPFHSAYRAQTIFRHFSNKTTKLGMIKRKNRYRRALKIKHILPIKEHRTHLFRNNRKMRKIHRETKTFQFLTLVNDHRKRNDQSFIVLSCLFKNCRPLKWKRVKIKLDIFGIMKNLDKYNRKYIRRVTSVLQFTMWKTKRKLLPELLMVVVYENIQGVVQMISNENSISTTENNVLPSKDNNDTLSRISQLSVVVLSRKEKLEKKSSTTSSFSLLRKLPEALRQVGRKNWNYTNIDIISLSFSDDKETFLMIISAQSVSSSCLRRADERKSKYIRIQIAPENNAWMFAVESRQYKWTLINLSLVNLLIFRGGIKECETYKKHLCALLLNTVISVTMESRFMCVDRISMSANGVIKGQFTVGMRANGDEITDVTCQFKSFPKETNLAGRYCFPSVNELQKSVESNVTTRLRVSSDSVKCETLLTKSPLMLMNSCQENSATFDGIFFSVRFANVVTHGTCLATLSEAPAPISFCFRNILHDSDCITSVGKISNGALRNSSRFQLSNLNGLESLSEPPTTNLLSEKLSFADSSPAEKEKTETFAISLPSPSLCWRKAKNSLVGELAVLNLLLLLRICFCFANHKRECLRYIFSKRNDRDYPPHRRNYRWFRWPTKRKPNNCTPVSYFNLHNHRELVSIYYDNNCEPKIVNDNSEIMDSYHSSCNLISFVKTFILTVLHHYANALVQSYRNSRSLLTSISVSVCKFTCKCRADEHNNTPKGEIDRRHFVRSELLLEENVQEKSLKNITHKSFHNNDSIYSNLMNFLCCRKPCRPTQEKTARKLEQRKSPACSALSHSGKKLWKCFLLAALVMFSLLDCSVGCPSSCVCKWKGGKMTVECTNKGLANLPPELDSQTQVLDFTGNSLVILAREKFKELGLINLQRIYVSRCKLVQLDDAAFRGLSNLVELDLSNNELIMVPVASLQHTLALMRLLLSHNPITKIKDGSFRRLQSLTSLEMTGCELKTLEPLAFEGLDKLEWLKLNDNHLTTVPHNMALPSKLHGVDLHNNPWHCDCKLKYLMSWLVNYNVPTTIESKCKTPHRLQNKVIKDIEEENFACAPEVRPSSLFRDVLEGRNVSFECHVIADPMANIKWSFNGIPLENSSLDYEESASYHISEEKGVSHLRIEMVAEAQDGVFECAAENIAGKMISNFTLRVSVPPTIAVPKDFIEDNFKYIGAAASGGSLLVLTIFCIIICKCCSIRFKKKQNKKYSGNAKESEKEKDQNMVAISSAPKYIQIASPSLKTNGISNTTTQPISVIEASPYRSNPTGSAHSNPDLISDSPVEERVKPKKKVSIIGVEEVDVNGVVTTRKLDDIAEEYEDSNNYAPIYSQSIPTNPNDFDSNSPYSNISSCRILATTNPYPLTEIPPDEFQRQHIANQTGEPINYLIDGSRHPKDDICLTGNGGSTYHNTQANQVSTPAYATIRRNKLSSSNFPLNNHIIQQERKFPEEYQMQNTNTVYQAADGRYVQSYGLVVEKYLSDGTPPTTASTSLTGCDCCPDQKTCGMTDSNGGRMSGDGCSFDNMLSSCNAGGPQICCYPPDRNMTEGQKMYDNSLPQNYSTMQSMDLSGGCIYGAGPLPPEGWRDSDCVSQDCMKDNSDSPWDGMPLSPGTRILYSPDDPDCMNIKNGNSEMSSQRSDVMPPSTQV